MTTLLRAVCPRCGEVDAVYIRSDDQSDLVCRSTSCRGDKPPRGQRRGLGGLSPATLEEATVSVLDALTQFLAEHEPCEWEQIGPCVYCKPHHLRLYQGSLPDGRRPECTEHDWDDEQGIGFYSICRRCGEREWFE